MALLTDTHGFADSDRPSIARRVLAPLGRLTVQIGLLGAVTLGGGAAATVMYDWTVPQPEAPRLPPPPEIELPPTEPAADGPQVDPLVQAVIMARADLPPLSLVDVQPQIEGDVVFLEGEVDSRRTIDHIVQAVGQVPGVAAVDARGVSLAPRLHIIERGDHPIKLSRRYYGSGRYWKQIKAANKDRIKSFRVGETLLIPPLD